MRKPDQYAAHPFTQRTKPDQRTINRFGTKKLLRKSKQLCPKALPRKPANGFLANKFGYDGNAQMLRRDFIRYYGTTPAAISKIKKLEEAKRLLATTTYSMKEIAVKLKYKSHTHFGMDFKNNIGMTPAEYRKAIKAKREKQMNTKDYQMNLKDYLAKMC